MTTPPWSRPRRAFLVVGISLYSLLIAPPLALSLVLLFTAETLSGTLFALDALLLLGLPLAVVLAGRSAKWRLHLPGALALAFVLLFGVLRALVPPGPATARRPGPATVYPAAPYQPWALSSLLPEIDQLKLGTYFVFLDDPILDWQGAARLRASLLDVYRPMERDPTFRDLGSAMTYAYSDEDSGHFYEYVPSSAPREKPPAVVFLHGSAGNFKGYLHVWKTMAETGGFVVVAPSFGFGNWERPGGLAAIERARRRAVEGLDADPSRIYLAGLSNGGRGVTRAIAALDPGDRRYAGVLLLSAFIEPDVIDDSAAFRGLPILVVHGRRDDRLPWDYLKKGLAALRASGADVTVEVDAEEDHFLFFSRAPEVQGWVGAWLGPRLGLR